MTTIREWTDAGAHVLRDCYAAEERAWRADLGWDTSWTWRTVEEARMTWGLPGAIAEDEDAAIQGWTFWMPGHSALQIGGVVASSAAVTGHLLDAVQARQAETQEITGFLRDSAPGLTDALHQRGFTLERFLYLSRPLRSADAKISAALSISGFAAEDMSAAAALLREGYTPRAGRTFAPSGTHDGWVGYVRALVEQRGCGLFDPLATCLVRSGERLVAMALMTTLAEETAHLAQIVVHPESRGRGLGGVLLREVTARAARAGRSAVTLLVAEGNAAARTLYARQGFDSVGAFLSVRREAAAAAGSVSPAA